MQTDNLTDLIAVLAATGGEVHVPDEIREEVEAFPGRWAVTKFDGDDRVTIYRLDHAPNVTGEIR